MFSRFSNQDPILSSTFFKGTVNVFSNDPKHLKKEPVRFTIVPFTLYRTYIKGDIADNFFKNLFRSLSNMQLKIKIT